MANLDNERVGAIDTRIVEITERERNTTSEQLLIILAQERLVLTNERISLTTPGYPITYIALPPVPIVL